MVFRKIQCDDCRRTLSKNASARELVLARLTAVWDAMDQRIRSGHEEFRLSTYNKLTDKQLYDSLATSLYVLAQRRVKEVVVKEKVDGTIPF